MAKRKWGRGVPYLHTIPLGGCSPVTLQGCKWSANWRISANFEKTGQKLAEEKKNWRHDHQKLAEGLAQQAVVFAENEKK